MTKENLNKIRCEECLHYQEAIQMKSFAQLPRILIVHLGRFDNELKKVDITVPTPMEVDCFCETCASNSNADSSHKYRLYGVIVHLGVSPQSGHYIAYARTFEPYQPSAQPACVSDSCCQCKFEPIAAEGNDEMANGFWYECDDEDISVMSQAEFEKTINRIGSRHTPYVLFYARNDLIEN